MRTWFACLAAAAAVTAAAPSAQSKNSKTHVRRIFVSVTDQQNKPVEGLSASNFTVSEGGEPRVVSHAGPAKDPMRIALMLDTSDAAAPAENHINADTSRLGTSAA